MGVIKLFTDEDPRPRLAPAPDAGDDDLFDIQPVGQLSLFNGIEQDPLRRCVVCTFMANIAADAPPVCDMCRRDLARGLEMVRTRQRMIENLRTQDPSEAVVASTAVALKAVEEALEVLLALGAS